MADAFEAGLWLFWVTEKEVIAVPRPSILVVGDRLHCSDGPAVSWPSGERYFFWEGVQVPEDVVTAPERITTAQIDSENNTEVRRVMRERYGLARYVRDAGFDVLDSDSDSLGFPRRLLRRSDLTLIELTNSTPEPDGERRLYHLRVHPEIRPLHGDGRLGRAQKATCINAVASTFGLRGSEYQLAVET